MKMKIEGKLRARNPHARSPSLMDEQIVADRSVPFTWVVRRRCRSGRRASDEHRRGRKIPYPVGNRQCVRGAIRTRLGNTGMNVAGVRAGTPSGRRRQEPPAVSGCSAARDRRPRRQEPRAIHFDAATTPSGRATPWALPAATSRRPASARPSATRNGGGNDNALAFNRDHTVAAAQEDKAR